MDIKNSLIERYEYSLERESKLVNLIVTESISPSRLRGLMDSLWYANETFTYKAIWMDQDYAKAKQHCYVCGLLYEAMAQLSTNASEEDSIYIAFNNRFSIGLVSDHHGLIDRLAAIYGGRYERYVNDGSLVVATQYALQDKWDALNNLMDIYNHRIQKRREKWHINDMDFFTGLLNRDVQLMEKAINTLLTPRNHTRRNIHPIYKNIVSHPALGYAKLAWLKGFHLELDNPLIPSELLPLLPLKSYSNPYPFLESTPTV